MIYRSPNLRVERTGSGPVDFVTFQHVGPPGRPPFGRRWACKHGLSALHVMPVGNDWYQYPDLADCLAAVREVAQGAPLYGSSMGGYAAVMLADRLGAPRTIALSPQVSIRLAGERRWQAHAARLSFAEWDGQPARTARHYVFYDPGHRDARHANLIAERAPDAVLIPVPYGGHPVGHVLAEAGVLTGLVKRLLVGDSTAEELTATLAESLPKSARFHARRRNILVGVTSRQKGRQAIDPPEAAA